MSAPPTTDPVRVRRGPVVATLRGAIRFYQAARGGRPSPCRFDPSCSTYALQAVDAHGAVRGTFLAIRRLLRCHPWGGFGYDPVPDSKSKLHHHTATQAPGVVR
jgi:uncharacterized protein